MTNRPPAAVVFVDPQCPFAWITYQWLRQAARGHAVAVDVRLMSLACVNEHQDIDAEYRAYNDDSWAAARVGAALLSSDHADLWPAFYDTYGHRRHVHGVRNNAENLAATIADLGLPTELVDAATDPSWDDDLRGRTKQAIEGVDSPGGTPITCIAGRAYFGPVLTSVPDIADAVRLWDALTSASAVAGFTSIATRRAETLDTGR